MFDCVDNVLISIDAVFVTSAVIEIEVLIVTVWRCEMHAVLMVKVIAHRSRIRFAPVWKMLIKLYGCEMRFACFQHRLIVNRRE